MRTISETLNHWGKLSPSFDTLDFSFYAVTKDSVHKKLLSQNLFDERIKKSASRWFVIQSKWSEAIHLVGFTDKDCIVAQFTIQDYERKTDSNINTTIPIQEGSLWRPEKIDLQVQLRHASHPELPSLKTIACVGALRSNDEDKNYLKYRNGIEPYRMDIHHKKEPDTIFLHNTFYQFWDMGLVIHPEYELDAINLFYGRDFLKEDKLYDAVILLNIFHQPILTEPYFRQYMMPDLAARNLVSSCGDFNGWNERLLKSGAKIIRIISENPLLDLEKGIIHPSKVKAPFVTDIYRLVVPEKDAFRNGIYAKPEYLCQFEKLADENSEYGTEALKVIQEYKRLQNRDREEGKSETFCAVKRESSCARSHSCERGTSR